MKLNLENCLLKQKKITSKKFQNQFDESSAKIHSDDHSAGTTWVDWPVNYDKKEFAKIQKLAKTIASNSDVLLVVGIGGSYLGAKAGLEMLLESKSKVEIVFAGTCFDYTDLVSEWKYFVDIFHGDIPCRNGDANASAAQD